MILGFSHLGYNVTKEQIINTNLFRDQGYVPRFVASDINNNLQKKKFLYSYSPCHTISLMEKGNRRIELIAHGDKLAPGCGHFSYGEDSITLGTSDIKDDHKFLTCCLGLDDNLQGNVFEVNRLVPSWSFTLRLLERNDQPPSFLDSSGFTCLALIVKDLKHYQTMAKQLFCDNVSDIFEVEINHSKLEIVLIKSRSGAFFELIEVK